jgi:hypothetical protein
LSNQWAVGRNFGSGPPLFSFVVSCLQAAAQLHWTPPLFASPIALQKNKKICAFKYASA